MQYAVYHLEFMFQNYLASLHAYMSHAHGTDVVCHSGMLLKKIEADFHYV